ncbi:class I adenylate-forming enzyme family protein [Halobacteriaceae archaeon GCM10025711]
MDSSTFSQDARTGNVARLFDETAAERGDAVAIEHRGTELGYDAVSHRTATFAGGLHDRGLDPGDRLLLYLPNCPQYVVAALGGFKAGTPVSPMNPQYKAREIGHQLSDTGAKAVVTHAALREPLGEALAESDLSPTVITVGDRIPDGDVPFDEVAGEPTLVPRDDDDVAMQPYTSGTTGTPKGVLLTHRNLRAQAFAGFLFSDLPPDRDRSLVVLPLYHITGFVHSTWQVLARGGRIYVRSPANWDAEDAMATIEAEDVSGFIGVSAMFVDMVETDSFGDYDLASLDNVSEGGAKMPVAVQERFEAVAGVDLNEGYGLTETTGATHTNVGATFGPRIGTVGQPLRMVDAKVVDESGEEVAPGETGELLVRGPIVMAGYHDLPDATEAAFDDRGYFRTGDVVRSDGDNYFEVVDRKKHLINTAGYNVYPSEVEGLLFEHDAVVDAAVVGVPDDRRGETVTAFVVPAPDADATPEDIKQFCLDNLAEYKHPREVSFVADLPRTASGKVQKYKLVERDADRSA